MQTTFTSRLAAIFIICTFLGNDLAASVRALSQMPSLLNPKQETLNHRVNLTSSQPFVSPSRKQMANSSKTRVAKNASAKVITYLAEELSGYLGMHLNDPLNRPADDFFTVQLDNEPANYNYAYLNYRIKGVVNGQDIPKSINHASTYKGDNQLLFGVDSWQNVTIELDKRDLRLGQNKVRFGLEVGNNRAVELKDVEITLSQNRIKQSFENRKKDLALASDSIFTSIHENKTTLNGYMLAGEDMPSIPNHITNVTRGSAGFRVYESKNKPVEVRLGVQRKYLASGMVNQENLRLFYFDFEAKEWKENNVGKLDFAKAEAVAMMPGGTDYFAGIIKSPEMPEANAFMPTALSNMQAASPAEGMTIIQSPSISQSGAASVSYPLNIPPGRNGLAPSLAVTYSSDAGPSWAGWGWNIGASSISIDTKWGTPIFSETNETESYTLDGSDLMMEGGYRANRAPVSNNEIQYEARETGETVVVNFYQRTVKGYKKIERFGDSPSTYTWQVTTASGAKYYYGSNNENELDPAAVLADPSTGNVVKWHLKVVEDKWGNNITYGYNRATLSGTGNPMKNGAISMYLDNIYYTGFNGDLGKYSVHFEHTKDRIDTRINARYGFRIADDGKLNRISVKYDGTEFRAFNLSYDNTLFFKTWLTAIEEERNGNPFYEHTFDYHDEHMEYGPEQTINVPVSNGVLLDLVSEVSGATGISSHLLPSLINSSQSYGFGLGGYVGIGWIPGEKAKQNKPWSVGGRLNYTSNYTSGKMRLVDFNGDGLPDVLKESNDNLTFYPQNSDQSNSFSGSNSITSEGPEDFLRSKAKTNAWGLEINPPEVGGVSTWGGYNNSTTRTKTETYTVDYNGDGLLDVVDGGAIYFNTAWDDGTYALRRSSRYTPNPVLKGNPIERQADENEEDDNIEIVKTWEAPFDGTIDILGTAQVGASDDGVQVAIQYNDNNFIRNFTDIQPSSSLAVTSPSSVTVKAGDLILFRLRCKVNGFDDRTTWNPSIKYQSLSKGTADLLDYAESDYQSTFLLSTDAPNTQEEEGVVKISWPQVNLPPLTDDLIFKVRVEENGSLLSEYYWEIDHGSSTFNLGVPTGETSLPALFGTSGAAINAGGGTDTYAYYFSIESNSNVDWAGIDWRPQLNWTPTGGTTLVEYPIVKKELFNGNSDINDAFSVSGLIKREYIQIFPTFMSSITSSLSVYPQEATLTVKTDQALLAKMKVEITSSGVIVKDWESLATITTGVHHVNQEISPSDIVSSRLYFDFSSATEEVADALKNYASISIYEFDLPTNLIDTRINPIGFSCFYQRDVDETGQDYFGWGQFGWSDNSSGIIPLEQMSLPNVDESNATVDGNFTQEDAETLADDYGLNDLRFFYGSPLRSESNTAFQEDCWTYLDTKYYASQTAGSGGILGEDPNDEVIITEDLPGIYILEGPVKSSKTKSQSFAGAFGVDKVPVGAGYSSTVNSSNYVTQSGNGFFDLNGDRYPEQIFRDEGNLRVQYTSPLGGHEPSTIVKNNLGINVDDVIDQYRPSTQGPVLSGRFGDEDDRYNPTASVGLRISKNRGHVQWLDINGDGLIDRLSNTVEEEHLTAIELNLGRKLLGKQTYSKFGKLPRMESGSFSLGGNYKSKGNMSWSAGLGITAVRGKMNFVYADINGDGLADKLIQDDNGLGIYLNTGTEFSAYTPPTSNMPTDPMETENIGGTVGGSFTGAVAIPLGPPPAGSIKGVLTINASGNLAVNNTNTILMDMNGDGGLDLVEFDDANGDQLKVRYLKVDQANLLKEVNNPLGGSFTINYKRVGNKYGKYDRYVFNHMTRPAIAEDKAYWDMPNSKWVMASVEVNDGVNIVEGGHDLDGVDTYRTSYRYDGGVYSRRERRFLGFSRTETRSPMMQRPNLGQDEVYYTISVKEYPAPESNDPTHKRKFEYISGLVQSSYTLLKYVADITDPIVYDTIITPINVSHNRYTYHPIQMVADDAVSWKTDYNEVINLDEITETESIFAMLESQESFVLPDPIIDPDRAFSSKHEFAYDEYMNPIRVVDNGRSGANLGQWNLTGTIEVNENTINVYELQFNPTYYVDIIALMHYFHPTVADGQTNVMRKHRVFTGDTTSQSSLQRYTSVESLQSQLAPSIIRNHLDASTYAETEVLYNSNGTVNQVTGPENAIQQRMVQSYSYDADMEQYVTSVSNSYGDYNCIGYNPETGQPTYTSDVNGNSTVFKYDNVDRIEYVFAPKEIANTNAPYTLKFEYHPEGVTPDVDYRDDVPVAFTVHYIAHEAVTLLPGDPHANGSGSGSQESGTAPEPNPTPAGCVEPTIGTRPSSANEEDVYRTETYLDGLGRNIQNKQDASKWNSSTEENEKYHYITSLAKFDALGRVIESSIDNIEVGSVREGKLGLPPNLTANFKNKVLYDMYNRPIETTQAAFNGQSVVLYDSYKWTELDITASEQLDYFGHFTHLPNETGAEAMNVASMHDSKGRTVRTASYKSDFSEIIYTDNSYDELHQLLSTTNAKQQSTSYTYDDFGRVLSEVHGDKGTSSYTYDLAGNLTQISTPTDNIDFEYNYNRLTKKIFPETGQINTVAMTYGSRGDGLNGAGRVVTTVQGEDNGTATNVLQEYFTYDELGNVVTETRKIAIPFAGEYGFTTKFDFDSWGRVHEMLYPDGERVGYTYAICGELEEVQSRKHINEIDPFKYINKIGYDGYGNAAVQQFGNGVTTSLDYDPDTRQLASVNVHTSALNGHDLIDKDISYFKNGNVSGINNTATPFSGSGVNDLGGGYSHNYQYDFDGRLDYSSGSWSGSSGAQNYTMDMSYNAVGGIIGKNQTHSVSNSDYDYDLTYHYQDANGKPHQIDRIEDYEHLRELHYRYDSRGNVDRIQTMNLDEEVTGEEHFLWDEVNRLRAVKNENTLQHNVYDGNGIRILKTNITESGAGTNGEQGGSGYNLAPYTTYASAFFVCQVYDNSMMDMSKHYYIGGMRIASKLQTRQWYVDEGSGGEPGEGPEAAPGGGSNQPVINDIVLDDLQAIFELPDPNPFAGEIDLGVLIEDGLPELPDFPIRYENSPCLDNEEEPQGTQMSINACECKDDLVAAAAMGINCDVFSNIYWYHPDYLGNTEFVTDIHGYPYQHNYYTPFGEALVDQHAVSGRYNNTYRFNAKELDQETGLYYYGARYYNPRTSVWISTDPMSAARGWLTPYNFVQNNPVMLTDPTGMLDDGWVRGEDGQTTYDPDVHSQQDLVDQGKCGTYLGEEGTGFNAETGRNVYYGSDGTSFEYNQMLGEAEVDGGKMSDHARTMQNPFVQAVHQGHSDFLNHGATQFTIAALTIMIPLGPAIRLARAGQAVKAAETTAAVTASTQLGKHALERLAQRGITKKMVEATIRNGEKFFDPLNKSVVYVVRNGFASGQSLLVATNPITGMVTTVIKSSKKLVRGRFLPFK
jgi:RHS repeat-associated protein